MKCHRLYIKLEYYSCSVIISRATVVCINSSNQSKGHLYNFKAKVVSEMVMLTLV